MYHRSTYSITIYHIVALYCDMYCMYYQIILAYSHPTVSCGFTSLGLDSVFGT